jgi:hypothetical protein
MNYPLFPPGNVSEWLVQLKDDIRHGNLSNSTPRTMQPTDPTHIHYYAEAQTGDRQAYTHIHTQLTKIYHIPIPICKDPDLLLMLLEI